MKWVKVSLLLTNQLLVFFSTSNLYDDLVFFEISHPSVSELLYGCQKFIRRRFFCPRDETCEKKFEDQAFTKHQIQVLDPNRATYTDHTRAHVYQTKLSLSFPEITAAI